ncbi:MFS transporter [Solirubrobacter soli]|uniref:MFS transporter n=1 Tax=Solirubrobacter soli TaxID=363832 RepID=UPI00040CEF30|nr:MFS transporter [Solirubrobacter soli]
MRALLLLCAAQFMVILDITVVNIALPSMQHDLGLAAGDLQWVITAYTLAFGGLLLLGGRAADLFGRRRMFFLGLSVFTAASLGAALSGSPAMLIVARVAQGVGAAMLSPAALSLVTTLHPEGPERHRALAAWAAVAASGGAVGVLVGGALTELFDWRAIFLVNVPVGIVVGVLARRVIARDTPVGGRIDVLGAALATAGLVALIYALVETPDAGWISVQTLGLFALAALGLAAFVGVERRAAAPLVPLRVLRRRPTVVALALMVVGMGTVLSSFFFLTVYLQETLGHSALRTGLEFLPGAVLLVLAAHGGRHLIAHLGAKGVLASGMTLGAGGALLLSGLPADGSYVADVLPGLLLLDLGIGLAASGIFITGLSGVGHEEAGLVSGLMSTAHEIGIALVLPVLSTIALNGGDAFNAAGVFCVAAALLALVGVRRADVAPGSATAFVH